MYKKIKTTIKIPTRETITILYETFFIFFCLNLALNIKFLFLLFLLKLYHINVFNDMKVKKNIVYLKNYIGSERVKILQNNSWHSYV